MNFFCILDRQSSLGFRLLGLEVVEVLNKNEALSAFYSAISDKDIGILIISSKIASLIKDEINKHILRKRLPFILEIQSKDSTEKTQTATEFLKKIIGFGS